MSPAETALISEIIKSGLGWMLAAYFYWQLATEQKDRRKSDADMLTLLLSLKDESNTRVTEANNRQTESFSKVGDAMTALTAEVRSLQAVPRNLALPPPSETGGGA